MTRILIYIATILVVVNWSLPVTAEIIIIDGIEFPYGIRSFADTVYSYSPGKDVGGTYDDPNEALGVPDYSSHRGAASLGDGGELILQFTDNSLTTSGDDANDLHIFEVGPDVEWMIISISTDASSWISLGEFRGQPKSIDIDAIDGVVTGTKYSFVRIQDDPNVNQSGSPYGEADIDAVGAISSAERVPITIYVDDDSQNDPGPWNPLISDAFEDGSREHPFDMIQEGIDAAKDGDKVIVLGGTYWETINFEGKSIKVTGFDPNLTNDQIQPYPVIDGNDQGPVVNFVNGEDPNTELSGFTITRGLNDIGSAIFCAGSHPMIANCLIVGNRTSDPNFGAAIYCADSNSIIQNCTITDNYGGEFGSSIYLVNSDIIIENSIVWGNIPEQIIVESGNDPIVVYSNIQGTWPGEGNIDVDPNFAPPGYWSDPNDPNLLTDPSNPDAVWIAGDYHLKSEEGRWNPDIENWVQDEYTSPCIDAGDPASDWSKEPEPNGGRINQGAYGGTEQASMTPNTYTLTYRAGPNGRIDGETSQKVKHGEDGTEVIAEPNEGYHFTGWSDGIEDANRTDTNITADIDVTANFEPDECICKLTISSSDGGSVTKPGEGEFIFDCNTVEVEATPEMHYVFSHWSGTLIDEGKVADPYVLNITFYCDGEYTLTANFERIYTLIYRAGPNGKIEGETTQKVIHGGSGTEVIAEPNEGYHFTGWSDGIGNANRTDTNVTADLDVTANFEPNEPIDYNLIISSTNGGSVTTPGEDTFTYEYGTDVDVEATADEYYYFLKWTGSAVDAGKVADPRSANTTVHMDGDYSLKANFAAVNFKLTVSSTDGGSVTRPGEGEIVIDGDSLIQLVAEADQNYEFVKWTGSAVDAGVVDDPDNPNTRIYINDNYNVKAHFARTSCILTISSTEGGSVTTPGEGTFEYDYGADVSVVATPDEHFHFVGWTGSAVDAGKVAVPGSASTTVTVEGDYTLIANFEIDKHILTIYSTDGGSVTSPGEGVFEYDYGTVVDLTATADPGYRFKFWVGPVIDRQAASTTVTITEDIIIRAYFVKSSLTTKPK